MSCSLSFLFLGFVHDKFEPHVILTMVRQSNQTPFFFLSDKCELTAGSDEKKTAQPRRGSNSGLPIAGRTL